MNKKKSKPYNKNTVGNTHRKKWLPPISRNDKIK